MIDGPVRASDLLRRSTPCPREALRLSSGTSPRCLEIRFYNRRFASRAPVETCSSESVRRAPWENPPALDFSDRPWWHFGRSEDDAGPPRGHPASNGRALDGALPASGLSTSHASCAKAWGEGRASLLFRLATAPSIEPSDISGGGLARGCRSSPFAWSLELVPAGARQCTDLPEPEMPSTGGDHASALARARRGALSLLASEGSHRACSPMLLEHRLDLSPRAFAREGEAACASPASADPCFHEHDCGPLEHPSR